MIIFLIKKNKKKHWFDAFFKYPKRHNMSVTQSKPKNKIKSKILRIQNHDPMTIPEIVGLMFLFCLKKPDKKDFILFDTVCEGPRDLAMSKK